jgi:hypothetical protein
VVNRRTFETGAWLALAACVWAGVAYAFIARPFANAWDPPGAANGWAQVAVGAFMVTTTGLLVWAAWRGGRRG